MEYTIITYKLLIKNQWITRAEAPVWASKVLFKKAVLDRLLAPLGTIPLDWGECGFIVNFYFVYMAFMVVWLGVVARSSMARGQW